MLWNKIKDPEFSFSFSKSDGKTRFQARNSLRHFTVGKIIEQSTVVANFVKADGVSNFGKTRVSLLFAKYVNHSWYLVV